MHLDCEKDLGFLIEIFGLQKHFEPYFLYLN